MTLIGDIFVKMAKSKPLTNDEREKLRLYGNELETNQYTTQTIINQVGGGISWPPADDQYYVARNEKWETFPYPFYENLTSQIDGSNTHFTYSRQSKNIVIFVNGIYNGPPFFIYDVNGLGFTFDTVLVSGDMVEVLIFPNIDAGDDTIYINWEPEVLTGGGVWLSSFALYDGTIPVSTSNPAALRVSAEFIGDAAANLTCYALNGASRVLTGTLTTDADHIYVLFPTASPVVITGFEMVLAAGGTDSYTPGATISTGIATASLPGGTDIAVTPGESYCLESTSGPFYETGGSSRPSHRFQVSYADGYYTDGGVVGMYDYTSTFFNVTPLACVFSEQIGSGNYGRAFFTANKGVINFDVVNAPGAYLFAHGTLGYILKAATISATRQVTLGVTALEGIA